MFGKFSVFSNGVRSVPGLLGILFSDFCLSSFNRFASQNEGQELYIILGFSRVTLTRNLEDLLLIIVNYNWDLYMTDNNNV